MVRPWHWTHHTYKDPNCFSAYYVSYFSHFLTEQAFIIGAALVCPAVGVVVQLDPGFPQFSCFFVPG